MGIGLPEKAERVISNIKIDIQREAPDSNPYNKVNWISSFATAVGRRLFDFYGDLKRTETRLFPDTADEETAPIWGNIYIGPENPAENSSGQVVVQGTLGSSISVGELLTANSIDYITTSGATIAAQVINVTSITRSGTTATVTTAGSHGLASAVPVTIAGADQTEYNLTDADIVVTGLDTFTYQVTGSPTTPATGTITISFEAASVAIESVDFGDDTNLDLDTPVKLQSPISGINDTLHVDFGAIGGGTDAESLSDYKDRYLDKIRNPVAHFNEADIVAEAKKIAGVTRVFVEEAGTEIGTISVTSITRSGNVATVVTAVDHGFDGGQETSITGAVEPEYNETNTRIIVEDAMTFHYVVLGAPATPATGTIFSATSVALGQVITYFMRDNDVDPIPSASEVQAVKDAIDAIKPANTSVSDNIVKAPVAVAVDYIFTDIEPNTTTMKNAVDQNIGQFHDEQTTVGVTVTEDAYRAAIKNTVDPDTGDTVQSFTLSAPTGDITINSGEIATKGAVIIP